MGGPSLRRGTCEAVRSKWPKSIEQFFRFRFWSYKYCIYYLVFLIGINLFLLEFMISRLILIFLFELILQNSRYFSVIPNFSIFLMFSNVLNFILTLNFPALKFFSFHNFTIIFGFPSYPNFASIPSFFPIFITIPDFPSFPNFTNFPSFPDNSIFQIFF